ncbi:hypothetical protein [Paraglaciecola sp. L3A3]|uniref:hypothetical protein n=1 Tax=Paraglaciecola sp. L3A3 TaxID=2686358 RepID=UPI00131CE0C5|nr:hypothetical protein [Paraglaciecola sp. L3A3]
MSPDEEQLKMLLSESTPVTDENKALEQVLQKSSNVTAIKDVTSLFIGWCWVVLLGFGASAYSAKRRLNLHKKPKRRVKHKN